MSGMSEGRGDSSCLRVTETSECQGRVILREVGPKNLNLETRDSSPVQLSGLSEGRGDSSCLRVTVRETLLPYSCRDQSDGNLRVTET